MTPTELQQPNESERIKRVEQQVVALTINVRLILIQYYYVS